MLFKDDTSFPFINEAEYDKLFGVGEANRMIERAKEEEHAKDLLGEIGVRREDFDKFLDFMFTDHSH